MLKKFIAGLALAFICHANAFVGQSNVNAQDASEVSASAYAATGGVAAAVAAIGKSQKTLVIDRSFALASNLTIPANVHVRFEGAGQLNGPSVVNIQGPITAPPVQIFGPAMTPSFNGNRTIQTFLPQWWGVAGDANADDQPALARMLASVPDHATVIFAQGMKMKLNSTLTISARVDVRLMTNVAPMDAQDTRAPAIIWNGPAGGTMLFLERSGHCAVQGFRFVPGTADVAIRIDGESPPRISTDNYIQYNTIDNSAANNPSFTAIQISRTARANNEFNHIEHNYIWCSNQVPGVGIGIDIGASGTFQSKGNILLENGINQCGKGVQLTTGSMQMMFNHSSANDYEVYILNGNDPVLIAQNNFESCKRCFYTNSYDTPVKLLYNRIYPSYTERGKAVINLGPQAYQLSLEGNSFENLPEGALVYDGSQLTEGRVSLKGNRYPSSTITQAQANYASFDSLNKNVRLSIEDERNVRDLMTERQYNGQSVQIQNRDAVSRETSRDAFTVESTNGNNNSAEVLGIRSYQHSTNGGGAQTPFIGSQSDFAIGRFNYAIGYRAKLPAGGGPGQNVYGFYVTAPTFNAPTANVYGLYLENLKGANVGNAFGVRQVGSAVVNQFDGPVQSTGVNFTNLPAAPANGSWIYCNDCDTPPSLAANCTNKGDKAGAMAYRIRGAWKCF